MPWRSRSLVSQGSTLLHLPTHLCPACTPKLSKLKAKRTGSPHPAADLPLLPNSRPVLDYAHQGSWRLVATSMTLLGQLPVGL